MLYLKTSVENGIISLHPLNPDEVYYKCEVCGNFYGIDNLSDLEIFENVAYIMAYHADHTIPDSIDEWLDQFEMLSIYEVLPEILALWGTNLVTDIESKKT